MKAPILLFCALFIFNIFAHADQLLISAQNAQKIEVYDIDPKSGLPTLNYSLDMPGNCGEVAISNDQKHIYVALSFKDKKRVYRNAIATLGYKNGKLELLHEEPRAIGVTHMAADPTGQYLVSASYRDGKVSMHPIQNGICKGPIIEKRSTDDNAHCVAISKDGRYAFVPHTGPNAVYQFRINAAQNRLDANDPPLVKGPKNNSYNHEPRHIRFHPNNQHAYTSNERGGGISFWKYDPFFGRLTLTQTESTTDHPPEMQAGFASADIQITPNGKFAYVTNRDNRNRHAPEGLDSITAFEIHPYFGRIVKRIGVYPTGRHPRVMAIGKKGQYLYCTAKNSDSLHVYTIEKDGSLKNIKDMKIGKAPMGIMVITPPKN